MLIMGTYRHSVAEHLVVATEQGPATYTSLDLHVGASAAANGYTAALKHPTSMKEAFNFFS